MPINAIAGDGTIHEFPDGTDSNVIDFAMKKYANQSVTPQVGPFQDAAHAQGPVGRILDAFGQGAKDRWGTSWGVSPEDEKELKDNGIFNDYESGHTSFFKSVNEAFMRPGAVALNTLTRGIPALTGGLGAAATQIGKEVGLPGAGQAVGEAITGLPEVLPGIIGAPLELPIAARTIDQARAAKVIGEGEAGWKGTAPEPVPEAPKQPQPVETQTPQGPTLVWKGGRYQKAVPELNSGEAIDSTLADMVGPETAKKPLSTGDLWDLADYLGVGPRDLNLDKINEKFGADDIEAAKSLIHKSAQGLKSLMDKITDPEDPGVEEFIKQSQLHRLLLDHISGLETKEIERELAGAEEEKVATTTAETAKPTGPTPQQQFSAAQAQVGQPLQTTPQINNFVQQTQKVAPGGTAPPGVIPPAGVPPVPPRTGFWGRPMNWVDALLEMRTMGLISGPATHSAYAIGNELLALQQATGEGAVAGGVGAVARMFGRSGGARVSEVPGQLFGRLYGQRQGLIAAGQSLRTGQIVPPAGYARPGQFIYPGVIPGPVGDLVRLPSRGMAMIHSYFDTVGASQWMYGIAYRDASENGLTPGTQAFSAHVANFVANPPLEAIQEAGNESMKQIFMGRGGKALEAISSFSRDSRIGKLLIPFARIEGNILRQQFLERTPLGLADQEIRDNIFGRNGPVAQDRQIAKILYTTAIAGSAAWLFHQGVLTGRVPEEDPKKPGSRAIWEQDNQPYSARIGDTWYSYQRLGLPGRILGMLADGYQAAGEMPKATLDKWAGHVVGSISKGILENTWLREISDIYGAIAEPDGKGSRWVLNNFITSFTPYSSFLSQTARAVDPDMREANNLSEAELNRLPYFSEYLHPKIGPWGQERPNLPALGGRAISSIYETQMQNDPVNVTLRRLGVYPAPIERHIRGVELNENEFEKLSRITGTLTKRRLDEVVGLSGFDKLSDGVQAKILSKVWSDPKHGTRELGRMQLQMDDPQKFVVEPTLEKLKNLGMK